MKRGYKLCLYVIITLLIITSSLATSYSLWVTTEHQTGTNVITAGCFNVTFNDLGLDENGPGTSINLSNTYPIADETGMALAPYTVSIENICDIAADYKLLISDVNDNTLDTSYINYYLTKTGAIYGPLGLSSLTPYTLDSSIKSEIETASNVTLKNSYVLATGVLNPGEDETYELRLWVRQDAEDIMEQTFEAVVSYEAYASNPHS